MEQSDGAPNAMFLDENGKQIAYDHVGPGDSLKVMYHAERSDKGWIQFSPAYMKVWLNGQPLATLNELTFFIDPVDKAPKATIKFTLGDVDIDADSLLALEAIVKTKEANGERSSEAG